MSTRKRGNSVKRFEERGYRDDDDDDNYKEEYRTNEYSHQENSYEKEYETNEPYTDDEGYRTEDNESSSLDGSMRSGMSSGKGVRFGPGTKEASEAGTDLESEADLGEDGERVSIIYIFWGVFIFGLEFWSVMQGIFMIVPVL